jgi:hypothetical protein
LYNTRLLECPLNLLCNGVIVDHSPLGNYMKN